MEGRTSKLKGRSPCRRAGSQYSPDEGADGRRSKPLEILGVALVSSERPGPVGGGATAVRAELPDLPHAARHEGSAQPRNVSRKVAPLAHKDVIDLNRIRS